MAALLPRPLRAVLVWNGEVIEQHVLTHAEPIVLGTREGATFPIPEGTTLGVEHVLLQPSSDGSFTLRLVEGMSGFLGLNRREVQVEQLLGSKPSHDEALALSDWGIVSIDGSQELAIFFQFLGPQVGISSGIGLFDRFTGQALLFSAVVHITLLVIAFVLWEPDDSLDVDPPPSQAIAKMLLQPPPEPDKPDKSADQRKAREDASKRAAKKEGKVGEKDAKVEKTKIPKGDRDQVAKAVSNMGLLGQLKQGKQSSALKSLLSDTPDATVTTAMAGLKGTELVVGRGAGGLGLKGDGGGGGGTGKGQLMGVGNLAVGGGGKGAHGGGGGGGGGGGTRIVKEVHVGMTTGNLSSEGGLSKAQIEAVVRSHMAALQFCYEKELQRFPHLAGSVKLAWKVEPDGKVSVTRVDSSSLGNPSAEGCMSRTVKGWSFPKSNGQTNVNFPFLFKGQ